MSELERALSAIGGELEYPPTPALAAAVRSRVATAPSPRRALRPRQAIALAFAGEASPEDIVDATQAAADSEK